MLPLRTTRNRVGPLRFALFASLCCLPVALPQVAPPARIQTIDGDSSTLAAQIRPPATLVLVASDETELREAQRLLTLAESEDRFCLILLAAPEANPLRSAALRRAARRFFASDFSRARVFIAHPSALPNPAAKALLLSPDSPDPLWTSDSFPETLPVPSR